MSKGDLVETEVKLLVGDFAPIIQKLNECGAELVLPRVYERNIRYENLQQTFSRDGIVLRLREDSQAWLTYKEPLPHTESGVSHRFEAEVLVSNLEVMDVILKKLGFVPYRIYEKYRTTYAYKKAEIVLDEMPYGNFVEIEGASDLIHQVLYELDWEIFPRFEENYLSLFARVKQYLDLQADDLTFKNFEGVEVPKEAFEPQNFRSR